MIPPVPGHCIRVTFCMVCAYTRPRYQVSVYRTVGPLFLQ